MYTFTSFDSKQLLDTQFADNVAKLLSQAIAENGRASLAVSGGSTPKQFFDYLSKKDIEWSKVTITLADERWVDVDDSASNTALVQQHLCVNNAAKATFFQLKITEELNDETLQLLSKRAQQQCVPFDVLILGMGEDGHTASLFPCSDEIKEALATENVLMKVVPKTAPHQRITFTLSALRASKNVFLHIAGESKKAVFDKATSVNEPLEMPIRAFLFDDAINVNVQWAK